MVSRILHSSKRQKVFMVKQLLAAVVRYIKILYMLCCRLFRGIRSQVLFCSFSGDKYSCNPRAVSEALRLICPELKQVWLFRNPESKKALVPSWITAVKGGSLAALRNIACSKVLVYNSLVPRWLRTGKRQILIQTWHGDRGCKLILYATGNPRKYRLNEEKYCSLMTTGSIFGEKKMRDSFHYHGEFLKFGSPRNDLLINPDHDTTDRIRHSLSITPEKSVLLYAPTFRDTEKDKNRQNVEGISISETLDELEKRSGTPWVCLLRAHPGKKGFIMQDSGDPRFINATEYEDIRDLMCIADFMITDYSSSCGDFFLTRRPLVLFHSDIHTYMNNSREFFFDFQDSPYIVAHSQSKLNDIIRSYSMDDFRKSAEALDEFYGIYETGESAVKAAEYIVSALKGEKKKK